MVKESSAVLPPAEEPIEAEDGTALKAEAEPGEPASQTDFVCDCEESMRSACATWRFYGAHEGRNYCVLHYPGKDKAVDFKTALETKLTTNDLDFRGVWFPLEAAFSNVDFSLPTDFSHAVFCGDADFRFARFVSEVDFSLARFGGATNFSDAEFGGVANFTNAALIASVDFTSAAFSDYADFNLTRFSSDARFGSVDFRGVADFTSAIFDTEVTFFGSRFKSKADFNSVAFGADATFRFAEFTLAAIFDFASFHAKADFERASFRRAAKFTSARFEGMANFIGADLVDGDYYEATFSADAHFIDARFVNSNFIGSVFKDDAVFHGASFREEANFATAYFEKRATFLFGVFRGRADFRSATFAKEANFSEASFFDLTNFSNASFRDYVRFGGTETWQTFGPDDLLDLQHARISDAGKVSFHSVTLRPNWFVSVDPRGFTFTNVHWNWRAIGITTELACLALRNVTSPARLLAIACRQLGENAEANNRYEEASRFRYWAMDLARRVKCKGWSFWRTDWLHMLYWTVSGYGERIFRALGVLAAVWIVFALLYTQVGFVKLEDRSATPTDSDITGQPLPGRRALTYSLAVMSLQKPEPKPLTGTAQTLVLLETILGPVQAALLLLAIRRKFMR